MNYFHNMSNHFDAIVAGHICLDLIPEFRQDAPSTVETLFTPGHLTEVGRAFSLPIDAWANRELWCPVSKVNIVGTTGAGDAAIAGFLGALLRGCTIEESATMAVATGACCVEAADATSGIRSWDETVQRIHNGWKQRQFQLRDSEWHFLKKSRMWSII